MFRDWRRVGVILCGDLSLIKIKGPDCSRAH